MYKRSFIVFLLLLFQVSAEEGTVLKPGAELQIDVSFLPEILAEFNGKKLLARNFLPSVADKLNPLAKEKTSNEFIRKYVISLINQKFDRIVSIELAGLAGVEPNIGLAYLELKKMEKDLGKKALTEQLAENGTSYEDAAVYMAESKAIDDWFREKIVPECEANEAECLLYYTENKDKFNTSKRVRFAQIFTGFLTEGEKRLARKKITEANYELSLGKDFSDVARRYSEDRLATQGGVDEKFYTEDDLIEELKQVFSIKVGERSSVIATRNGFHILKILELREGGIPTFAEVKTGLILTMSMEKARSKMNSLISERKKDLGFRILCNQ